MRLRKSIANLHKVADIICSVACTAGPFCSTFYDEIEMVKLESRRDSIGSAVLDLIPDNWYYRVKFSDGVLFLLIWI